MFLSCFLIVVFSFSTFSQEKNLLTSLENRLALRCQRLSKQAVFHCLNMSFEILTLKEKIPLSEKQRAFLIEQKISPLIFYILRDDYSLFSQELNFFPHLSVLPEISFIETAMKSKNPRFFEKIKQEIKKLGIKLNHKMLTFLEGETTLLHALSRSDVNLPIVKKLIKEMNIQSENTFILSASNILPVEFALMAGSVKTYRFLKQEHIKKMNYSFLSEGRINLLHIAASNDKHKDELKNLISFVKKEDLTLFPGDGVSGIPVIHAIMSKAYQNIETLLEESINAPISVSSYKRKMLKLLSILSGYDKYHDYVKILTKRLTQRGIRVLKNEIEYIIPEAYTNNAWKNFEFLIQNSSKLGLVVNNEVATGRSLLYFIGNSKYRKEKLKYVQMICEKAVKNGEDLNLMRRDSYNGKIDPPLYEIIAQGETDQDYEKSELVIQTFIDLGVSIAPKGNIGKTPLFNSIETQEGLDFFKKYLSQIVSQGHKANPKYLEGKSTLLHYALLSKGSIEKAIELTRTVLKNGEKFNTIDHTGESPLTILTKSRSFSDFNKFMDFLLEENDFRHLVQSQIGLIQNSLKKRSIQGKEKSIYLKSKGLL